MRGHLRKTLFMCTNTIVLSDTLPPEKENMKYFLHTEIRSFIRSLFRYAKFFQNETGAIIEPSDITEYTFINMVLLKLN